MTTPQIKRLLLANLPHLKYASTAQTTMEVVMLQSNQFDGMRKISFFLCVELLVLKRYNGKRWQTFDYKIQTVHLFKEDGADAGFSVTPEELRKCINY